MGQLAGRNTTMENIATIVFSKHFDEEPNAPSSDGISEIDQDTSQSDHISLWAHPVKSLSSPSILKTHLHYNGLYTFDANHLFKQTTNYMW